MIDTHTHRQMVHDRIRVVLAVLAVTVVIAASITFDPRSRADWHQFWMSHGPELKQLAAEPWRWYILFAGI